MLCGVLVAGIAVVTATSAAGWLVGRVVQVSVAEGKVSEARVLVRNK
jgi:hypothetical protein